MMEQAPVEMFSIVEAKCQAVVDSNLKAVRASFLESHQLTKIVFTSRKPKKRYQINFMEVVEIVTSIKIVQPEATQIYQL